jgi:O-antigen ligase
VDFFLFILVNATLFIRPSELIPELAEVPIYNILIVLNMAVAFPSLINHLQPHRFAREPVTACVLGMIPAVILSHLTYFDFFSARMNAFELSKVIAFYFLLLAVLNSTQRLRLFLQIIAIFAAINCLVAVLHHQKIINVPALEIADKIAQMEMEFDSKTGQLMVDVRLRATGIFNDPNDLSTITVVGIMIGLFGCGDSRLGFMRFAWIGPIAIFFLAFALTQSRGGLLALAAALGTFSYVRFGFKKTLAVGVLVVPAIAAMLGSRQLSLDQGMDKGTGTERLELWRDGLDLFKQAPVFGIGYGNFVDEVRKVAHNSYVQSFAELGFVGGTLFLGTMWFAFMGFKSMRRMLRSGRYLQVSAEFRRLHPYMLAILVGYATSIYSISRQYVIPTYMILGISNAYFLVGMRSGLPAPVALDFRRVRQLIFVSAGFLILIRMQIKLQLGG